MSQNERLRLHDESSLLHHKRRDKKVKELLSLRSVFLARQADVVIQRRSLKIKWQKDQAV